MSREDNNELEAEPEVIESPVEAFIDAPTDDPLVGAVLGSYEIGERIGAGEYGVVYRARHRLLGWERALKLLPASLPDDEEYVDRLIREIRVAADLRHPNIVQIHDVAIDEQFAVVVMDLLDGQSLDAIRRPGSRLRTARVMGLLEQLATALDCAHDAGIVHGDLKPANIVVGPNDRLSVIDFCTARAFGGTPVTETERVVGTPAYMAPESIRGTGGGITADQYALGVLAYELLVGQLPFAADDLLALLDAHLQQPPPSPRSIRADLSDAAEQVLLRQLDKRPDARYTTASDFVTVLRIAMEDRPSRQEIPRRAASVGPRQPDPWTSLQAELQEKHRSQQSVQPPAAKKSRRAFLVRAGTLAAGTATGGWLAWSLLRRPASPGGASRNQSTSPGGPAPSGPSTAPSPVVPAAPDKSPRPREAEDESAPGSAGSDLGARGGPTVGHRAGEF
jgi:serine/threonine protein kinase